MFVMYARGNVHVPESCCPLVCLAYLGFCLWRAVPSMHFCLARSFNLSILSLSRRSFLQQSFELDASGGLDTGKERRLMDIKKKLALNAPAAKKKLQLEVFLYMNLPFVPIVAAVDVCVI